MKATKEGHMKESMPKVVCYIIQREKNLENFAERDRKRQFVRIRRMERHL